MADTTMQVIIELKDKLSASLKDVQSNLSKAKSKLDNAADASNSFAFGLTAVGASLTAVAAVGINFNAEMETTRQGLVTLLGTTEEADKTLARVKEEAKRTPFEIGGLSQATQLMASVTKNGDKAINVILDVGEGLAAMGKGQAELDRLIVNLQQIGAVGKASMLDIKQFAFAGIPIFEMLKETTGKTGDALAKFIEGGGVTFELLTGMFDKANDAGGRFFNAYKNQTGTLTQLWSNFKDTLNSSLGDIVKTTGLFDLLKDAIARLTVFLPILFDGISKTIGFLRDNPAVIYIIAGAIIGGLVPAIWASVTAFAALAVTLLPFLIGGAIIGALVAGIVWLVQNWDMLKQKVIQVWDRISGKVQEAAGLILSVIFPWWKIFQGIFEAGLPIIQKLWDLGMDGILQKTKDIFNSVMDVVKSGVNYVVEKLNKLIRAANSAAASIAGGLGINLPQIPEIPMLAKGGIVNKPTLAMIGESGPEAVVPLNKSNGGFAGMNISIVVNGDISGEDLVDKVGDALTRKMMLHSAIAG